MLKKYILSFVFSLMAFISLCSAGCPVSHAALAKKFWDHFPQFDNKQKSDFIAGTLFPDIRYLVNIPREVTHYENISLDQVLNAPTAFQAGLLFHSYVDDRREIFVIESGIYDYVSQFDCPKIATQLKLAEDEILYGKGDWKAYRAALKKIHPEERLFGIVETDLQKWHLLLDYSFSYSPASIMWYLSTMGYGAMDVTEDEMDMTYEKHKVLSKDPLIIEHTEKLMSHFDLLFAEWKAENQ